MRKIKWAETTIEEYHSTLKYWKKKTQSSEYSKRIRLAVKQAQKEILEFPLAFPVIYKS